MLKDLLNKKALSQSDKDFIFKKYFDTFGREMRLKGSKCRDCFNDALIELINHERQGHVLRGGVVVEYNGQIYTRLSENIPDEVFKLYKNKFIK